jgi:hypothetical protein
LKAQVWRTVQLQSDCRCHGNRRHDDGEDDEEDATATAVAAFAAAADTALQLEKCCYRCDC